MSELKRKCGVCGKPSSDFICEPCKSSIRAEAAGRKFKDETKVRVSKDIAEKRSKEQ